jgi:hypothetical protein
VLTPRLEFGPALLAVPDLGHQAIPPVGIGGDGLPAQRRAGGSLGRAGLSAGSIRDISPVVGLTERTVQGIVADLAAEGYITRARVGRRTRYTVNPESPFRHRAQEGLQVGPLLDLLTAMADTDAAEPLPDPGRRLA